MGDEDVFHAPVFVVTHEEREPLAANGTAGRGPTTARRAVVVVHGHGGGIPALLAELAGQRGAGVVVGDGDGQWPMVHADDLARLEDAGLVQVVGRGPRRSKTYDVTDAGREKLRQWLLDAEPDCSLRNEGGCGSSSPCWTAAAPAG